jgi:formylglycine-generating enzyme required for sulfatase activity
VKAALVRALASGHADLSEAKKLLEEAVKILPAVNYNDWPYPAKAARFRQKETAENSGLAEMLTVVLPGERMLKLMLIPPGEFDRRAEGQARRIRITRPFYLGATEVTRAQFAAFIQVTGHKTEAEKEGGAFVLAAGKWQKDAKVTWKSLPFAAADDQPAVCVSWIDAKAFCDWPNANDKARPAGWTYRLPSEAEWEHACRAGSAVAYANGDGEAALAQIGWCWSNAQKQPQPVGKLAPNAWGLFDMHGNAWEWCADKASKAFLTDGPAENPLNLEDGSKRVFRGGSWACKAALCGADARDIDFPVGRITTDTGFRVALVPAP